MGFGVRGSMKILNDNVFKYEVSCAFNSPTSLKVWSNSPVDVLEVDNKSVRAYHSFIEHDKYVALFSLNPFYKAQILQAKKLLSDVHCSLSPSFLVRDNSVEFVDCVCDREYFVDSDKVLKVDFKYASYKKLHLNLNAKWKHGHSVNDNISHTFSTHSVKKLDEKLPMSGDYGKLRFLKRSFSVVSSAVSSALVDCKVFISSVYRALFVANFSYCVNVFRNEILSFKFSLPGVASDASEKVVNYFLNLPDLSVSDNWKANAYYLTGDVVFFQDCAYKATCDNAADEFDHASWEKIDLSRPISFYNMMSFFDSIYGGRFLKLIRNVIPIFIEEQVSDFVTLKLVNADVPKLNDFFVYADKKFRVVKFDFVKNGDVSFVTIVGQELLQFESFLNEAASLDDFAQEYVSNFKWKQNGAIPSHDVVFFNAKDDAVDGEKCVEGFKILLPNDVEIRSNFDIELKGGAA